MKNTALVLVAALDLFLYMYPKPEAVEPVRAATLLTGRVAAAKVYFHSPLDAPAMSPSVFTGMGYFSSDASSEFRDGYHAAVSVTPVASNVAGSDGLSWSEPNEAADIGAIQKIYKLPKVGEAHPTISQ